MRVPSVIVVLLLVMLSAPAIPVLAGPEMGAPGGSIDQSPIPILTLSLEPNQVEAQVTQSETGEAAFEGTATVDQLRVLTSTVTLTAVVNTGWPVQIDPQTMEFTGSGSQSFHVTVVVPPATSSLITGNVVVTGSLKTPGLAPIVASCSAVVTVSEYLRGALESADRTLEVGRGDDGQLSIVIWNHGNGQASFHPSVVEAPEGIGVLFDRNFYSIEQDESENMTVTFSVGDGADTGRHTVTIQVEAESSDGDREMVATYPITVVVQSVVGMLGLTNIIIIIVVVAVVAIVVALWKKGRLPLPRRSRPEEAD